jgi:hypothetical protein
MFSLVLQHQSSNKEILCVIDRNYNVQVPLQWLIKYVLNNPLSRRDIFFNSEAYTQIYSDHNFISGYQVQ